MRRFRDLLQTARIAGILQTDMGMAVDQPRQEMQAGQVKRFCFSSKAGSDLYDLAAIAEDVADKRRRIRLRIDRRIF